MTEAVLRILACQITIPETRTRVARDRHLADLASRLRSRLKPGEFDLIVLPELSSIEYSDAAFGCLDELEESLDGPSFETFSAIACDLGVAIAFGFPRRGSSGRHICQAVIGSDGRLLGHYDKLHAAEFGASSETAHFRPGDHLFAFDLKGLRIAPVICYDIRFDGLFARLAREGVDLVLHCGAYFRDPSFHSWPHFVVTRAIEHNLLWLSLNRAGSDWGGSIWCPAHADSEQPEVRLGTDEIFWHLHARKSDRLAASGKIPIGRDRRRDYDDLVLMRG